MSWFPAYRVVVFKTPGDGFDIFEIDATTDEEAFALACLRARRSAFELWDAAILLGRYDPAR